jgi:tRNA threonylcarbamoyladenosine biosynthesis protein TsaB
MSLLPLTLAIDTAAPRLQLGLVHPDGRADWLVEDIATGHAERLFGCLETLLARNELTFADLGRVASTTGPGSFTGLRIGLSAARGLGLARGIPVIGVPSLLALSLSADGPCTVLLDARRGEAYLQGFSGPGEPTEPARLVPLAEAEALVPADGVVLRSPFVDIVAVARFAASADPASFPPEAAYVRDADAKPQTAARLVRQTP